MTKQRIQIWYDSWKRVEIVNEKTGKVRYETLDCRSVFAEPKLKANEYDRNWYGGAVYVSFSGGKDSTVLKHIVDSMGLDIPAVFVNTGLEYPEIQRFAMSRPNVITLRPQMRFDQVLKQYGYPVIGKQQARYIRDLQNASESNTATTNLRLTGYNRKGQYCPSMKLANKWVHLKDAPFKISEQCCDVMKKDPMKKYQQATGRVPITATMACESALRHKAWMMNGCNAFEAKTPISQPMAFWTEQDVLEYIVKYNVPYCSVYGEIMQDENGEYYTTGEKRTGCIFCCFGCHLEAEPNRFQRLKETHPRQYDYCINGGEMVNEKWEPSKDGLGLGKVLDYIGVSY